MTTIAPGWVVTWVLKHPDPDHYTVMIANGKTFAIGESRPRWFPRWRFEAASSEWAISFTELQEREGAKVVYTVSFIPEVPLWQALMLGRAESAALNDFGREVVQIVQK